MAKFVASIVAGVVATVLGGLILNYLTSPNPSPIPPAVGTSDLPPGFKIDEPTPPSVAGTADLPPGYTIENPAYVGYPSRSAAEKSCEENAYIFKYEHGPLAGRYFCF